MAMEESSWVTSSWSSWPKRRCSRSGELDDLALEPAALVHFLEEGAVALLDGGFKALADAVEQVEGKDHHDEKGEGK